MRTRWLAGSFVAVSFWVLSSQALAEEPGATLMRGLVPEGFGVNIHFTDPKPGEMERFAEGGFGLARMDFAWGRVERERGQYDFSAYERLTASLKAAGARPLYILDYGNRLYDEGEAPRTEEGRLAFARFASAAARQFQGQGVLWEMWNEPNLDNFWKPRANAEDYAALAVTTARAMREADPQAVILAPGTSGFPWSYFETVFGAGLLELVDGVSVHPYRGEAPETAAADFARLRGLMDRHASAGRRYLPIVSSEWGYTTAEPHGHLMVPEDQQARYLARQWLANLASGVNVSIFYDWKDDGPDPKEREHRFGTVRQDFSPKPAFLGAKRLIEGLRGYTFRHRLAGEGALDWRVLFQKGETEDLAVVEWSTDPAASLERQAPVIRKVTRSDAEYEGLLRLAGLRWEAGPRVETRLEPAVLRVKERGDGKASEGLEIVAGGLAGSLPQEATVEDEHTVLRVVTLPAGLASEEVREVPIEIRWQGKALPGVAPIAVVRSDPIRLLVAPRQEGMSVIVEDPAGKLTSGRIRTSGGVLEFTGENGARKGFTLPEMARSVRLEDGQGRLVAETRPTRFLALAVPSGRVEMVLHVENKGMKPEPSERVEVKDQDAPARYALAVPYHFEPGWRYLTLAIAGESAVVPEGAEALWMWVKGDGTGNHLRARVRDATGQVFQINVGALDWEGWRPVRVSLDDRMDASHWGGADDGVRHLPLRWESLLLIDSAHKERDQRGQVLLSAPFYEVPVR